MAEINMGLLECNTPERYEALGRLVVHTLRMTEHKHKDEFGFTYYKITVIGS